MILFMLSQTQRIRNQHCIVSAFIALYLLSIATGILITLHLRNLLRPAESFFRCAGLKQDFHMFARVTNVDFSLAAIVYFDDGTWSIWRYPTTIPSLTSSTRQYFLAYTRKWLTERTGKKIRLYRDFARCIARSHDPKHRHPIMVVVVESLETILVPKGWGHNEVALYPIKKRLLFKYAVQRADLG